MRLFVATKFLVLLLYGRRYCGPGTNLVYRVRGITYNCSLVDVKESIITEKHFKLKKKRLEPLKYNKKKC